MTNRRSDFLPQGKALLICLGLFALAGWTYEPALRNGFVNIDDGSYVYANAHARSGLTWENIRWAFTSFEKSLWHPLTWLSIFLDCQLFGMKAGPLHLTNVLLHCANTLLLFLVLRRMTGAVWRSAFVAALFALHPLHVESVAWISERKDVLSTLFWLLTMDAYGAYVSSCQSRVTETEHGTRNTFHVSLCYVLALLFFALGLLSKPMLVTLPLMLLLLDWWPLRRLQLATFNLQLAALRRLLLEKIPFLVLALVVGLITVHAQESSGALAPAARLAVPHRLANAISSYGEYLAQAVWPVHLAVYYPYPKLIPTWPVIGEALLVLTASALALWAARSRPYLAFGWIWYLVTLLPVIGLVQVGHQAHADRYTYVPLIGLFVLLAWGTHELARRWRHQIAILSIAAAVVLVPCVVLARQQIGYWKDSVTLFSHALEVTENNDLAHNNLGTALLDQGQAKEAIPHFQEVVRLDPHNPLALRNLGTALFNANRLDEALPYLQAAVRLKPDSAPAHSVLGTALGMRGQTDEAIGHLQEAVRLAPGDAKSHGNLGVALAQKRRFEEAIVQFQEVLKLLPGDRDAQKYLRACLAARNSAPSPLAPAPNQ